MFQNFNFETIHFLEIVKHNNVAPTYFPQKMLRKIQ